MILTAMLAVPTAEQLDPFVHDYLRCKYVKYRSPVLQWATWRVFYNYISSNESLFAEWVRVTDVHTVRTHLCRDHSFIILFVADSVVRPTAGILLGDIFTDWDFRNDLFCDDWNLFWICGSQLRKTDACRALSLVLLVPGLSAVSRSNLGFLFRINDYTGP